MTEKIVIVDYRMGNLNSVRKQLLRLTPNVVVSSDPSAIEGADKLVLPGIGHFQTAMQNIETMGLLEPLREAVMVKQKPTLGICLGLQLMAETSAEGGTQGLGWIEAEVVRFDVRDNVSFKVPHMGWNQIQHLKPSVIAKGIPDGSEFYFAHSYHLALKSPAAALHETTYEYPFVSAIERGNLFGVQYHPEKSHDVGAALLENFIGV